MKFALKTFIGVAFVTIALSSQLVHVFSQESGSLDASVREAESKFLSQIRQLTFDGLRSGEGYYSADGRQMVFQSEREADNPFYQIYWMDFDSGDVERVSPGYGKTTCAWIHPDGKHVLFASTQFDGSAREKQQAELDFRNSGQTRRYSWDYDPEFELVEWNRETKEYRRLTQAQGYDAEACYSPDGEWIVFSSNRRAYASELSPSERALFELDPASAADIYIMRRDGSDLRRLTEEVGYDGGPFFSPDGSRICWRRFSENGAVAEIFTMAVSGEDVRQLTRLDAMSWAPFYHPSGEYLIFATNIHGFGNFELYLVDAMGSKDPVRVTWMDGFDGLATFSPDGKQLAWTSNRTSNKRSQIFIADWNHQAAIEALGLQTLSEDIESRSIAKSNVSRNAVDFRASDIGRHIDYLCRPELGGRLTGTEGERKATAYVASYFENLGLEPAGNNGGWYQEFPFTAGIELGDNNELAWGENSATLDRDWRPISFSRSGRVEPTQVVFAGYGIVAPQDGNQEEYDSYVHLDVEGKWVLVLRQMPSEVSPERRQHLARYSSLRYKATAARDRGAIGLIVVSGPTSGVRNQLVPLQLDGSLSGTSIAAISVTDAIAESWFAGTDESLAELQKLLDRGEMMMGFKLPSVKLTASIDIRQVQKQGRNVLGILRSDAKEPRPLLVVGAHIDHLGQGQGGTSLAKEEERNGIHFGADDNASGVAGMLEIAEYLAGQKREGRLALKQDILFAAWSGEELGLIGSAYFADKFFETYPERAPHHAVASESQGSSPLYPAISASLNLDMIGRLREALVLQGIGSSPVWEQEIERRNVVARLPVTLQNDSYLPTDASSFYLKGVPILSAFTGSHSEYHTPRDTPELINFEGAANIAKLMGLIARGLATSESIPEFVAQKAPENQGQRAMLTAYLGTIPDYAKADVKGVLLSGVASSGPAAAAGVKASDVVIELAGKKVENIYDYTFAIEALRAGQETEIVVQRGAETIRLKVTPTSRQ